ncbi:sulfate ABC transporter permease subunit CysT [Commensalibacter oyaizuii]|uniref:Sulfate transport system permease protein CysT n=1 Tax=Commensalibacter oyaizuii TaxID=3043873 RepID=A0ABT6Q2U2_9PROT|nr:sulfate ABC transporter permease subunit CysT [Commensalibacter sp. TBRC 16381]MDI2091418.1 sulfate ABC transporter permease subunit CysT [Commensalibacter sp. TBRC 16381]
MSFSKYSVIPGFWLSLGYTLSWLSLIVLIPLAGLILYTTHIHWHQLVTTLTNGQLLSALKLSLYTSFCASLCASIIGSFFAWMLTRHNFVGKKIIDSMIDLPLALPTAIAGIALTTLYAPNGLIGSVLPFKVAYTPLGIIIALVFVTIPFTIRTLEPVIKDIPASVEEAAKTLGATPLQSFLYIIFPMLFPAWLTGFSLAMARSLGEYGSVVFIAANIPYKTEILPILIVSKLDQFDYVGATIISVLMLIISFGMLFIFNITQRWIKPHRLIWFITHFSFRDFTKKRS